MDYNLKVVSVFNSAKKIIDNYVREENILSFVIGKTDCIEARQSDERYEGYILHQIADDPPEVINRLEKSLILLFHVDELYREMHEKQNEGGQGNDKANKLYIAIKTKKMLS